MDKVTLTFNMQELNILNEALISLPYRVVAPVIDAINTQVRAAADKSAEDSKAN